jgi:hypothetical protein
MLQQPDLEQQGWLLLRTKSQAPAVSADTAVQSFGLQQQSAALCVVRMQSASLCHKAEATLDAMA